MQTRNSFNAGELSPEMGMRTDMEQYFKGVARMENWHLSQMGGISRRKGLRRIRKALSSESRLFPFVYSYAEDTNLQFLVEIDKTRIRVLGTKGEVVKLFTSGNALDSETNDIVKFSFSDDYRAERIGKMMVITSINNPPLVLEREENGTWNLHWWSFKHHPWRHVTGELRENAITITDMDGYGVVFDDEEDATEKNAPDVRPDWLRASYWVEQREMSRSSSVLLGEGDNAVQWAQQVVVGAKVGDRFAVAAEDVTEYFVCTADWKKENYVASLDLPTNYPNNFLKAESPEDFDEVVPVYSINDVEGTDGYIKKGTKIAIKSGYWEYYTCIKDFNEIAEGYYLFSDYPGYFIRGLAVGDALPCGGEWEFLCSGVWYGSYEVRRNYTGSDVDTPNWEDRGMSFSRIAEASNTIVTGTEADEECYLRLFITRSKRMADRDMKKGFPADSCGNRLIVKGYKHDTLFKATPVVGGSVYWACEDSIKVLFKGEIKTRDWSWHAFSERYGYPLHCKVYNKRLVFASTLHQPQTLWFSRTDDLDNFMTGDVETSAMVLTMDTPSQNPICWMHSRSHNLMVGTCEGEFIISAGQSEGGISNSNAVLQNHGFVGSQEIAALGVDDKIIYVERGSSRVREYGYSLEADGYRSLDLTVLAPHILREHGGARDCNFMRKPDTVLMVVLNDGQLALCVYNTFQQVKGWHRWITDGAFCSCCSLPDGSKDDKLFFIVKHEKKSSSGVVLSTETWIETIDSRSNYTDHGTDYVSLVETNALDNALQAQPHKSNVSKTLFCMGDDFKQDGSNLMFSADRGKKWYALAQHLQHVPAGWNEVPLPSGWQYETTVSIKVTGNNAFELRAICK